MKTLTLTGAILIVMFGHSHAARAQTYQTICAQWVKTYNGYTCAQWINKPYLPLTPYQNCLGEMTEGAANSPYVLDNNGKTLDGQTPLNWAKRFCNSVITR